MGWHTRTSQAIIMDRDQNIERTRDVESIRS